MKGEDVLPPTRDKWIACMTSVGGSDSFYQRYGFRFVADVNGARSDRLPLYRMVLLRNDLNRIKSLLVERNIQIENTGHQVPTVDVAEHEKA